MKKSKKSTADQISKLVNWADATIFAAVRLKIDSQPVAGLTLTPAERELLAALDSIPKRLKTQFSKSDATLTTMQALGLSMAIAGAAPNEKPARQKALLRLSQRIVDSVQEEIDSKSKRARTSGSRKPKPTKTLYQFKITLRYSKPPIWRRIQVLDCTLDKFHEHIQTAMGWTNSHLHQFEVDGVTYGDPALLGEDCDFDFGDSTRTILSEILPADGKKFRFRYEYDFGDGWLHEVLFERSPEPEKDKKYPLCVAGALACPPEDVGGIGGYYYYLDAISNPKHEEHKMYLEWNGPFDPDAFDPAETREAMRQGLPDWRG